MFPAYSMVEGDYAVYATRTDDPDDQNNIKTLIQVTRPKPDASSQLIHNIFGGAAGSYAVAQTFANDGLLKVEKDGSQHCDFGAGLQLLPPAGLRSSARFRSSTTVRCAFGTSDMPPWTGSVEGEVLGTESITIAGRAFDAIKYTTSRTSEQYVVNAYRELQTWTSTTQSTCWAERQTAMTLRCDASTVMRFTDAGAAQTRRFNSALELEGYAVQKLGAARTTPRLFAGLWYFDYSSAPTGTACWLGMAVAPDGRVYSDSCSVRINGAIHEGMTTGTIMGDGTLQAQFVSKDNAIKVQYQGKLTLYGGSGTASTDSLDYAWTLSRGQSTWPIKAP